MAIPQRDRGSIVDTVTLEVFRFQWEPTHKEVQTTKFGSIPIIGRRLAVKHWVGEGEGTVDVTIKLTGSAHSDAYDVPEDEVGALRAQRAKAAGQTYVGLNTSLLSPVYDAAVAAATGTVAQAQSKIRDAKKKANRSVLTQIELLMNLKDPQEDTGAPHPVYLNIGGVYAGRKFLVTVVHPDYETHNNFTMEPTEATVRLKFMEITDFRKV